MEDHHPLPAPESASNLVTDYLARLRQILLEPTRFFREMPIDGGLSGPLAFALVTPVLWFAVARARHRDERRARARDLVPWRSRPPRY